MVNGGNEIFFSSDQFNLVIFPFNSMTTIVVIYVKGSFKKMSFEKKLKQIFRENNLYLPSQFSTISMASFGEDVLEKYKETWSDEAT